VVIAARIGRVCDGVVVAVPGHHCSGEHQVKSTLIVMTLNEVDGVKVILPQINRAWVDQFLVVDGGSTDGTIEWCRENGYEIYVQKKKGIRFGYFEVLDRIEGDIIVTFSPDGNCPIEWMPALIDKVREGYDLVMASRYLGDATSEDDDFLTGFGNPLFTGLANLLHGRHYKYTDAMGIYRAFRKHVIYDLELHVDDPYELPERLFRTIVSWEPLMSVRALKKKMKIDELPVGEPKRISGKRKLQPFKWGAVFLFQFVRELWYWPQPR
jgi:glycosyltransferase involved in cell wall biosynthesis